LANVLKSNGVTSNTSSNSHGDFTSYTHSIYILSGISEIAKSHYNVILLFIII
jgi:hypothetical protein